jgi:glycosyltransferase involved in cell wall biosynthesis
VEEDLLFGKSANKRSHVNIQRRSSSKQELNRKMKILQVTSVFPPHLGGLEKCVYNISKGLVEEGHQAIVYTTNSPRSKGYETKDGIVIHRIPVFITVFGAPITLFLPYMIGENVDLIHVHVPPVFGAISSIVFGKMKRAPVILTFHNDTIGGNSWQNFLARIYNLILNRIILSKVNLITVPSKAYRMELKRRGIDENRIITINNGIELSTRKGFNVNELKQQLGLLEKEIVLFVGSLEKRKGVEFLIKAFPRVKNRIPNVKFLIVGNGTEKTNLESLAHNLKASGDLLFTGHVTDKKLEVFYEISDVFVLPSLYETFGLVLLEAMAHRKPVVATRILGVSELVNSGLNGILVEPKNPKQLSEAIIQILSEKNYANQLGMNGERFSKKFEWKTVVSKYVDAYQECLRKVARERSIHPEILV